MKKFSGEIEYDIYNIEYTYEYDPGVRYYSDGSGTPPSSELEILKVTSEEYDENDILKTVKINFEDLDLKTQKGIKLKCQQDADGN